MIENFRGKFVKLRREGSFTFPIRVMKKIRQIKASQENSPNVLTKNIASSQIKMICFLL